MQILVLSFEGFVFSWQNIELFMITGLILCDVNGLCGCGTCWLVWLRGRRSVSFPEAPELTRPFSRLPYSCLRSWFQRQQTCPTCRMDVLRASNANQAPAQAQAPPPLPAGPPNAPAPPPAHGEPLSSWSLWGIWLNKTDLEAKEGVNGCLFLHVSPATWWWAWLTLASLYFDALFCSLAAHNLNDEKKKRKATN